MCCSVMRGEVPGLRCDDGAMQCCETSTVRSPSLPRHLPLSHGTLPKTRTPEWNGVARCSGLLRSVGLDPGYGSQLSDWGQVA